MNDQTIIISASTGIYKYALTSNALEKLIGCQSADGKTTDSFGYFGLSKDCKNGKIYFASREKGEKIFKKKKSSATTIYSLNKFTNSIDYVKKFKGIEDVHQIALDDKNFYLTDTGRNRIWVQDRLLEQPPEVWNIGWRRKDLNHINSIALYNGHLMIGLNNRGRNSEIVMLPDLSERRSSRFFPIKAIAKWPLSEITHTHDMELSANYLFFCASHEGVLYRLDINSDVGRPVPVIHSEPWLRGIAVQGKICWVGVSQVADRTERYSADRTAKIIECSLETGALLNEYKLGNIGQINDMCLSG